MWRRSFFFFSLHYYIIGQWKNVSRWLYDMRLYLIIDESKKKSNPRNWRIQFKVFNSPFDIISDGHTYSKQQRKIKMCWRDMFICFHVRLFVFFLFFWLFVMYDSFRLYGDAKHVTLSGESKCKILRFHSVTAGNCFWVDNSVNMT